MTTPSVTLRLIQNKETGIDISAPSILEEEAPLGGTSILYEISVLSTLEVFKNKLHKSEDVVHFSIFKAYREIEDFYSKIKKKFPTTSLPVIVSSTLKKEFSREEKLNSVDVFMKIISQNNDICNCSIFSQFIGINQINQIVVLPKEEKFENITETEKSSKKDDIFQTENIEESLEEKGQVFLDFGKKVDNDKVQDDDVSDIFPKMKTNEVKPKNPIHVEQVNKSSSGGLKRNNLQNVDLFEEVKIVKEIEKAGIAIKKNVSQGLFDDFEDDSLFSSKPSKSINSKMSSGKPVTKTKEPSETLKTKIEKSDQQITEGANDSKIIIKDRKIGEISLFKEQDFGDYITKDEESLFLVSSSTKKEIKKNTILFLEDEEPALIEKKTTDDNLDDLLNFEPLPPNTQEAQQEKTVQVQEEPSKNEEEIKKEQPLKPIPRPRKKSLEMPNQAKPEVLPRKVFLNKPPPVAAKPTVAPKPTKPNPPPKKPSLIAKANEKTDKKIEDPNANNEKPKASNTQSAFSDLTDDLNKMDILKYIEQEEKTVSSETSLFD